MKAEEQFGLIFDDCYYESTTAELVDWAMGSGIEYLNVKGVLRSEKQAKANRAGEVLDELRGLIN